MNTNPGGRKGDFEASVEKNGKTFLWFFVVFNGVCVEIDGKNVDGHESEKKKNRKIGTEKKFQFFAASFLGRVHKYTFNCID